LAFLDGEPRVQLPTEAQWERATRGQEARLYPWGNAEPEPNLLNFNQNVGHPTPVGIYPRGATPEGIQDLAGNVWEWCADWYGADYYARCAKQGVVREPAGPEVGEYRVLRGGSWIYVSWYCRAASRGDDQPGHRSGDVGFRLVLGFARQARL
jgi:formylglycine-generating enzyme required for sulfatase activity